MSAADIAPSLKPHLEATYGIAITRVSPIDGGHLFRIARSDGPDWVARPFPSERPRERVVGDTGVLRFLEARGYPSERCGHSDPVSTLDGWTVLVTELVDGTPPGSGGRANVALRTFRALGDLLGRVHAMTDLPDPVTHDGGSWHGDPLYEGLPAQDIAAARAWLASVEQRIPADRRAPYDALLDELGTADVCGDLPRALVHPDAAPVNAILAGNGDPTYVDWTGAGLGPRVCSFANLLWSAVGQHEGPLAARIEAIVAGYRSHIALTDDELARLAGALRIRPLLFACWNVRGAANGGNLSPGNGPWFPDRKPMEHVADLARAAFAAEERPAPSRSDDQPTLFGESA